MTLICLAPPPSAMLCSDFQPQDIKIAGSTVIFGYGVSSAKAVSPARLKQPLRCYRLAAKLYHTCSRMSSACIDREQSGSQLQEPEVFVRHCPARYRCGHGVHGTLDEETITDAYKCCYIPKAVGQLTKLHGSNLAYPRAMTKQASPSCGVSQVSQNYQP
jgi:hypothetical protein